MLTSDTFSCCFLVTEVQYDRSTEKRQVDGNVKESAAATTTVQIPLLCLIFSVGVREMGTRSIECSQLLDDSPSNRKKI
jgi:hypothetical protein